MKILKESFQIFGAAIGGFLFVIVVVSGEIALAMVINKWTSKMPFEKGMSVMIISFALLAVFYLAILITCAASLINLTRLLVGDFYKSNPGTVTEGAETVYELLKKIKDKRRQISLATIIFLTFLDVIPPLKKIFKSYLQKLRKEVAST